MKITSSPSNLRIGEFRELDESHAEALISVLRTALTPFHSSVEFDLSQLQVIDCTVADVLMAVYEEFKDGVTPITWRVLNPSAEMRQLFELMRLHRLFEIVPPRPVNLAAS